MIEPELRLEGGKALIVMFLSVIGGCTCIFFFFKLLEFINLKYFIGLALI